MFTIGELIYQVYNLKQAGIPFQKIEKLFSYELKNEEYDSYFETNESNRFKYIYNNSIVEIS